MIRVAVILNRFDAGGIEAIVSNYYKYMDKDNVQIDFYYDKDSTMPLYDKLKSLGAGLYPMPGYTKVLSYHRAHYKAFKENDYHIVHAHVSCMSFFSLLVAKRAGVPVRICHAHTVTNFSEGMKALLKYILRPLNRLVSNCYFACGENAAKWMYGRKRVDSGEVTIMTNAIEVEKFAFDSRSREDVRKEFGIPDDALVLGHVGRFAKDKNHKYLLKIFNEVLKQDSNAYLLCIGDGELFDEIKAAAPEHCIFTGTRYDVDRLYSAMDVFVFPSFVEGLPLCLVEAQCNGLTCISSDTITRETDITGSTVYLPINGSPSCWVGPILSAKRFVPSIPDKWDVSKASKWLENWYLSHNDYVSIYTRNSSQGMSCYYRIGQYRDDLSRFNPRYNDAVSEKQYRKNLDDLRPFIHKLYQAYLFLVICRNRNRQLRQDLKGRPKHVVVQREIVPKIILPSTYSLLKKLCSHSSVIWDFDDDLLIEGEISRREFDLLQTCSNKIIVTSEYLRNMLSDRAKEKCILMPTTQKAVGIDTGKSASDTNVRVLWLGSASNLSNLDLVGDMPEGAELIVVCNRPYIKGTNIQWTREAAIDQLKKADIGIMPLADEPYSYGKGGFKLIQYMSSSIPVISSPVGFNNEIVKDDFGILTDDFKTAISELLDSKKRLPMGKAALEEYKKNYSYDANLSVWKNLLS